MYSDDTMRFTFRTHPGRLDFVRHAIQGRCLTLLDVGNLGDGESTCAILKKDIEKAGGTYYGLDSNEPLTRKLHLPNQIVGDLHHTNFQDNLFDMIYAGEILEHTWTPGQMIAECWRILKPGGQLVLDTPNPYSTLNIARFLLHREDNMGDNRVLVYHEAKNKFENLKGSGEVLLQPQHKIFFTPAMLKQLLETHGFILEEIGCTVKPRGWIHHLLLWLFPQTGPHLCIIARKASIDIAFADVLGGESPQA